MLDWDDLRHFTALADAGTLSAAARRLRVEHATVARRVAALEAATGAKLVDRRSGRYVLTDAGQRVAQHARRMEDEAFALERALQGSRETVAGTVSVSAPPLFASMLLAPRLTDLRRRHPQLHLRLLGEARWASLSRGEADVVLRLGRPADPTLVVRLAGSLAYGLFAAPGYAEATPAADVAFIAFDESLDHLPQQQMLLEEAGERPVVLRSNDLGIQMAAAQGGTGVVALPAFAAVQAGLVPVSPRRLTRDLWLAYHQDLRGSAAVAAMVGFLVDCVGALRT